MDQSLLGSMSDIKDGASTGEADLKLTTEVRDAYIKAVHDFRDLLKTQLTKVNGLPGYGAPGDFQSAAQTKSNLENGIAELKRVIANYNDYLDEFADTVTEAGKRLIQSG